MNPEEQRRLAAIGRDPELDFRVNLHRIFIETDRRLELLAQSVRECKDVNEANNFARWLQFSGILKLLETHPQAKPANVDGARLHRKASDLAYECGQLFRGGKADPKYTQSDIAEINRKLGVIAEQVGVEFRPSITETADVGIPTLHVIQGGVF